MSIQQYEKAFEAIDQEADALATFLASLDTSRLHMIGHLLNDELTLRSEGKPCDKARLH